MGLFNFFKKGIKVELYNLTSEPLSKIAFEYQGGNETVEALLPGKQYAFDLIPVVDSDLRLIYHRSEKNFSHTINTYFGINYTGKLTLKVNNDNTIEVVDDIKI